MAGQWRRRLYSYWLRQSEDDVTPYSTVVVRQSHCGVGHIASYCIRKGDGGEERGRERERKRAEETEGKHRDEEPETIQRTRETVGSV